MTVASATINVLLFLGSWAIIQGNALGIFTLSVILLGVGLGFGVCYLERKKRRAILVRAHQSKMSESEMFRL